MYQHNLEGKIIGKYKILKLIGSGGFGAVYRAVSEQIGIQREVAVKTLNPIVAQNPEVQQRFIQEIRISVTLLHPNIVQIYDYGTVDDISYIVMPVLEGGSIEDVTQTRRLSLAEIADMLEKVGDALDYGHSKGVIHRDLKPSNIMFDSDNNPFLVDFGIARLEDVSLHLTHTQGVVGTPAYMSPEQCKGETLTGASDQYSLAVVVYQLVTGQLPFEASTPMAFYYKHVSEAPISPMVRDANIAPAVANVLLRALEKNPAARFKSVSEFAEAFRRALPQNEDMLYATYMTPLPNEPTASAPGGFYTSQEMRQRRQSTGMLVGLLVVIVAVIAGIVFMMSQGEADEPKSTQAAQIEESNTPTDEPTLTETARAVVEAVKTDTAEPSATATDSVEPSATPTSAPILTETDRPLPTATNTEEPTSTDTATATLTNTPSTPQAEIIPFSAQVYLGPSTATTVLATLRQGTQVDVLGVTEDERWLVVGLADGQIGYVSTTAIRIVAGDAGGLAIVALPTATPTATETPTLTPSPTATQMPTNTATLEPTIAVSNTPAHTPTPIPPPNLGVLPFLADMEDENALQDWTYDASKWQRRNVDGNHILYGYAGLSSSVILLGQHNQVPEWMTNSNLIYRFRFLMENQNAGARFIFQVSDRGYYVLDILGGLLALKRGNSAVINRSNEIFLERFPSPDVSIAEWHDILVWVENQTIYLYFDHKLIMDYQDNVTLPPGSVQLQTIGGSTAPTSYDDILIQRPEAASGHFVSSSFPSTWVRDPQNLVSVDAADNNQFLLLRGAATARPLTPALNNFLMTCNIRTMQGDFNIRLRDSVIEGALLLEARGGNLEVLVIDPQGNVLEQDTIVSFYSRDWNNWFIEIVGNRVLIYDRDGLLKLDRNFQHLPSNGDIVFETRQEGDILRVDDCIIAPTTVSSTVEGQFAFDIIEDINRKEDRFFESATAGSNQFSDNFSDAADSFLWTSDPGLYESDGVDDYYTFNAGTQIAFRRVNREVDEPLRRVFDNGIGLSDYYVRVQVRIPPTAPLNSTAWVGVRSELDSSRTGLDQYQIEFTKEDNDNVRVRIRPFLPTDRTYIYDDLLTDVRVGDWIEVIVVCEGDRCAFFAGGRYLATIRPTPQTGGTVAIGVQPNSVAQFDNLLIRDVLED